MTDSDRRVLNRMVGKQGVVAQVVCACMVPLLIGLMALKLQMAHLWADLAGVSIGRLIALWFRGVSAEMQYSGSLIRAEDDLTMCLALFGLTIMFAVVWWACRRQREMAQRIVNALQGSGAW
ncbi:MAG TPA: hypothetical protein VKT77_06830 [Chthonomonadaceae bacterium]|nr:hypothetical protein [Chthonomonadaceae bacterium]